MNDHVIIICASRIMSLAEETLSEFLKKATGTAINWIQMPGMKVVMVGLGMQWMFDANLHRHDANVLVM